MNFSVYKIEKEISSEECEKRFKTFLISCKKLCAWILLEYESVKSRALRALQSPRALVPKISACPRAFDAGVPSCPRARVP